jgi:sulfatase modifying factor 1
VHTSIRTWSHRACLMLTAHIFFLFSLAIALPTSAMAQAPEAPPAPEFPLAREMVLVPGGEFLMGGEGYADSAPVHSVRIAPFYLDKYEVTNAQYAAFCDSTKHDLPEFWGMDVFRSGPKYPNHPVVGVSWASANDYAEWRGGRLPTEAEWEYAARGGLVGKKYSLGDERDSTLYAMTGKTGEAAPSPVGMFPANGFGLHDMTGNVCEWVADIYDADYYKSSPADNPTGPSIGGFRVIRGGGWHTGPSCSRVFYRGALHPNWLDFNVGFRVAKNKGASAATKLEEIIRAQGIERALEECRAWKAANAGDYYFSEFEMNEMAYRLFNDKRLSDAIAIFELNAEAYPHSYNAYDSLAEAYAARGDRELAIQFYNKALEIHPGCRTAREGLEKLEAAQ